MTGQERLTDPIIQNLEWLDRTPAGHPGWVFVLLLALAGLLAWIRIYYGNILVSTLQASVNYQVASRTFKDNSILQKQLDNILYIFYLLSFGCMCYVWEVRFGLEPYGLSSLGLYLFNVGLLGAVFLIRVVLLNLSGFLFNRIRVFREYLYNTLIYNKLVGVIILPLMLFAVYTTGVLKELFFWVTVAAAVAILVSRLIRGGVFSFKKDISMFYIFLYLCALEIVPLALLFKWFEGIL